MYINVCVYTYIQIHVHQTPFCGCLSIEADTQAISLAHTCWYIHAYTCHFAKNGNLLTSKNGAGRSQHRCFHVHILHVPHVCMYMHVKSMRKECAAEMRLDPHVYIHIHAYTFCLYVYANAGAICVKPMCCWHETKTREIHAYTYTYTCIQYT